jgi:hypothetical protein
MAAHRLAWVTSVVAVVAVSVVVASPAVGKEPTSVVFCGKSDCRRVVDRDVLALLVDDGPPVAPAPQSQSLRWLTVRVTVSWDSAPGVRGHETYTERYYPDARMLRGPGRTWTRLSILESALYLRLTDGIEPFGAPQREFPNGQAAQRPMVQPAPRTSGGGVSRPLWLIGLIGLAALIGAVHLRRRRPLSRPIP